VKTSERFFGRDRELGQLVGLLDTVAFGRGALAIVTGEPGIGKTRLADELSDRARSRGFRVGYARTWPLGEAPAFHPWVSALRQVGVSFPSVPAREGRPGTARFLVFREVEERLRSAAEVAPLLLVFDDVHVADTSSLLLLEFIARELRTLPLVLVATRRDADALVTQEHYSLLARLAREGTSVSLERLGERDVRTWVEAEAVVAPPAFSTAVWEVSGGNPLFVTELLRVDRTAVTGGHISVPTTVREALRQRVSAVSSDDREFLDMGAVLGVEFELGALCLAAGRKPDEVIAALGRVQRHGIVSTADSTHFRFSHGLLRDVVYRDLSPERRANLHAAAAMALSVQQPRPTVELAHHALSADPCAKTSVAHVLAACRDLERRHAVEDAVRLLEAAVAAIRNQACFVPAELSLALGSLRLRAGDRPGGRAIALGVLERARSTRDPLLFARAVLVLGEEFTLGRTETDLRSLLEEALRELPATALRERAQLTARLSAALQPSPHPADVARTAEESVAVARETGDERLLLEVIHVAAGAWLDAVPSAPYVPHLKEGVRLALRLADSERLLRGYLRLVFGLLAQGRFEEADTFIDAYQNAAGASFGPDDCWPVPLLQSLRALRRGDFEEARRHVAEARPVVEACRNAAAAQALLFHELALATSSGARDDRLALQPRILAAVARWNGSQHYSEFFEADLCLARGELARAREHLARVPLESEVARIHVGAAGLAHLAIELSDVRLAGELYERLSACPDDWVVNGFSGFYVRGTVARLVGGLANLLGRPDEAESRLARAFELGQNAGVRPELRLVMLAQARLLEARGRVQEARSLAAKSAQLLAPATAAGAEPGQGSFGLMRAGETWQVSFLGQTAAFKAGLGFDYLERLMAQPHREIHVLELAGRGRGEADRGDAGELIDEEARVAYKRRLAELDEELAEAETLGDGLRASRARSEIEFLSTELSRAVDVHGRLRRAGVAQERARVAVTRRLRAAVERIGIQLPEAALHLERSLRTGTFCCYSPR
jgi:hypothetical protein